MKDLYDTAGDVTGYGNPDWARTHAPATQDAAVVMALLNAGARLVGKTKTVELAYGLTGENVWHGTPINPGGARTASRAGRPAGRRRRSRRGCATSPWARIPAGRCGSRRPIAASIGIRPSWGAVSLTGACPLGPAYDTAGWFAGRASLLRRAGEVLLPPAVRWRRSARC